MGGARTLNGEIACTTLPSISKKPDSGCDMHGDTSGVCPTVCLIVQILYLYYESVVGGGIENGCYIPNRPVEHVASLTVALSRWRYSFCERKILSGKQSLEIEGQSTDTL